MVARDLSGRYRGSVIGLAWLVLLPLVMMVVYAGLFAGVLGVRFEGAGSAVGAGLSIWIGIVLWQAFAETITRATSCLHDNAPFVRRIPFPLAILPVIPLGTTSIGVTVSGVLFAVSYVLLLGLPPLSWLQVPLLVIPFATGAMACAWIVAAAGAFVRDLKQVMPVVMTLAMFATPIVWPASSAPGALQAVLFLNPFSWFFESMRGALFSGNFASPWSIVCAWVSSYLSCVIAYMLFIKVQKVVSDVV